MYQAKLLKLDELIEEEVLIEINEVQIVGFASICPYKLTLNKVYSINLGLTFIDDPAIAVLDEPQHNIKRVDKTFGYILCGQICGDSIDIGNGIKIKDDVFSENPYLNKQYIKIKADRLSVEFI